MTNINPPGHKGIPFLGSIKEVSQDPLEFTTNLARKHPGIASFNFLGKNVYVISSPEYVRQILQTNQSNYVKSRHYHFLSLLLGNGLITSEGSFWKRQRKLTQPAFYKQTIEGFINVFKECTDDLVKEWNEKYINKKEPVEILSEMSGLALRIVGKTLLSVDLSVEAVQFKDSVKYGLGFVNKRQNSFIKFPLWFPTHNNSLFLQYRKYMDNTIYRVIDERLKSGPKNFDLLDMYLRSKDEETGETMSREQLRDEVMTVFVAGFETNAIALTWTWYLLQQNPEVLQILYTEVDKTDLSNRQPEEWFGTDYVTLVLKEAMRLFPPVFNLGRTNLEDDQFGPYTIKKGGVFLLNTVALHSNPQVWEQPEKFIPERFHPANQKSLDPFAYIPFGAGQRMCIGNNFAMLEMKVILHTLAKQFALTLKEGHPIKMTPAITLNPRYGMPMYIRKRN